MDNIGSPLVSIIVPVYNEEMYLDDCISSIISQTYKNFELILVDDGSTNTAGKICDKWASKYKQIHVIHKQNEGLSSARITGLSHSSGEWITFVDNDDIIYKDMLNILMNHVQKDIDIVAGGRFDTEHPEKVNWPNSFESYTSKGSEVCEKIGKDQQKTIITPLWGKIYRRSFLDKFDLLKYKSLCPTIYFEDVLMTPILFNEAKNICIIKAPLYIHRSVDTSISRSGKLNSFYYEQIDSGNILVKYCKKHQLKETYEYELAIYIHSIIRIYCLINLYLGKDDAKEYKQKIKKYFKKYYSSYLHNTYASKQERITARLFNFAPDLLAIAVRKKMK